MLKAKGGTRGGFGSLCQPTSPLILGHTALNTVLLEQDTFRYAPQGGFVYFCKGVDHQRTLYTLRTLRSTPYTLHNTLRPTLHIPPSDLERGSLPRGESQTLRPKHPAGLRGELG